MNSYDRDPLGRRRSDQFNGNSQLLVRNDPFGDVASNEIADQTFQTERHQKVPTRGIIQDDVNRIGGSQGDVSMADLNPMQALNTLRTHNQNRSVEGSDDPAQNVGPGEF